MSKYESRALELTKDIRFVNHFSPEEDIELIKIMCQLAEKVEEESYIEFKKIRYQNLFTKEQVEELLQKQRELCAEKAETTMEHCGHSSGQYCECQREIDKDSILNAKLKID